MRTFKISFFALLAATVGCAQQWELGAGGGVSIYKNASITSGSLSGDAGFKPAPAISVFATQNMYKHMSGQIRYDLQFNDLCIASGGQEATFKGQSHAVHYDLMFLAGSPESPLRPYVLVGGGAKVYRGTGKEQETQTLGELAVLTHTQQTKALITFGGGFKAKLGRRAYVYAEARDFLTQFPNDVIAPIPPAKVSGWIHDFVPMVGLSFSF